MMTKATQFVRAGLILCAAAVLLVPCVRADGGATKPTTPTPPNLTDRQASLLMQLAETEANIKTINQALVRTGYKVGLAYQQIEASQLGNELMDRRGGGPVGWEQFYGSTAAGFYYHSTQGLRAQSANGYSTLDSHANGSQLSRIDRPRQFDYIYRANNEQIERAQEQISSLSQNQAALLARREQHEMNQSRIWAEFSWEQVRDQEIAFRPLYRFKLQPDEARTTVLRGPILFLRTADKALAVALDSLDGDQAVVFSLLQQRMKTAYGAVQQSMADVLYSPQLSPADAQQGDAMKTICKNVNEECSVIADNYQQAVQSDAAREDASKLAYRAQLQTSIARLSTLMSELDTQIALAASSRHITPVAGTASPDEVPAWPTATSPTVAATPKSGATPPITSPTPISSPPDAVPTIPGVGATSLLDALTVKMDVDCDQRPDCLRISLKQHRFEGRVDTATEYTVPLVITAVTKTSSKELRLFYGDRGIIVLNGGPRIGELRHYDPKTGRQRSLPGAGEIPPDEWVTVRWIISEDESKVQVNGEDRGDFRGDYRELSGRIGVGTHGDNLISVKSLTVQSGSAAAGAALRASSAN